MRARTLLLTLLIAAPAAAQLDDPAEADPTAGGTELTIGQCRNGADDDGDGAADCADADCRGFCAEVAPEAPPPPEASPEPLDEAGCEGAECERTEDRPGTRGIYAPREPPPPEPVLEAMEHDDPRRYPIRHARRPMTYLEGMLVPRVSASGRPLSGRDLVQLGLGVSYGILDPWQVTVLALPMRLVDAFDIENVAISTTFRLFDAGFLELGLYGNVAIPVGTAEGLGPFEPLPVSHLYARSRYSTRTQLDLGLLARFHVLDVMRVDMAVPVVTLVFLESDDVRADLSFDLTVWFSPIDYLRLGVWTGTVIPGADYDEPKIPLGFAVGGTFPGHRRGPSVDLALRFGWPLFWDSGVTFGDEVDPDFWQLTFDVEIYSYLLP